MPPRARCYPRNQWLSRMPAPAQPARSRDISTSRQPSRFPRLKVPEVWVRFLLAILGLALAFTAALFSTVARESGNLWATLILASAALLLAVFVGLTTVPYLMHRVAAARFAEVLDYDVTRVGIFYVVGVVVIGVAALNTGNNLLYIIVAAMLAAILVSGIVSAFALRGLRLDVRLPEHVFARRPAVGRVLVRNPRRWLPSFSINVVSLPRHKAGKGWRWLPSTFSFPPGRPPEKQWIRLPDRRLGRVAEVPETPPIFDGPAYFPYLPAHTELAADVGLYFERRGRYQQESFGLATRFPFAFLTKTRHVPLTRELIVYPSVEPTDEFFEVLPLITGEFETFVRGRGTDLYRIREYTQEDSARHVDWKATAKSGSLKVREFTREDERKLRLVFDNPQPEAVSTQQYEAAVTLAASLGWHFAGEDAEVSFLTQECNGGSDIHQFLRSLALAQPRPLPSVVDSLPLSGDYNIILTARPHGSIPTALWTCSYFIFLGDRAAVR
jgi:uncharacterized protein (DUF58 family)